ncbi:Negative regulator of mitotic exit [Haplosporangium bisporale]|nr:Negative regulator of mitotic exit [Haplosporangium bisporale]
MYIFGGQFNGYYFNDVCSFDMKSLNTANPKWNRLEPASELPPARAGHCAAAYDGKFYIFGGADEQFFYNDIWCYDPQANKWEAVPAFGVLPTSRQGHAACVVDDTMYIYGGMNHEDQLLGDLSAFKFNERRWLTYPDTLESAPPRTEHAMCNVGDKIYILGGQLELNADDDAGSIYILDTTKIRFNDPSAQRPGYENSNDSTLRLEDHRPTPSPDSTRHFNDFSLDPRRPTQAQQLNDSSEQYSNSNSATTTPPSSQPPIRMSLEGDNNPTSRRRTTNKPAGYRESESDQSRAMHSIDETRRPGVNNEDQYERDSSRSSTQRQQQQQDVGRRSLSESRNRGSYTGRPSLEHSRAPSQKNSSEQLNESKDVEIRELRQREQWLLAEVAISRKKIGASSSSRSFAEDTNNLAAAIALQDEMGAYDADQDSEKYRIMQALLNVKNELERSKASIVQQAQSASNKLREAERVRTAALQEAAYLKAKVSALQSGEVSALASTETARAVDLEKRLTTTLAMMDKLQSQLSQHESVLERERHARELAQDREREASERAEELQVTHSRSLSEVASLHDRASVAEADMAKEQENNEVQLGLLRGVMRENGLLADDLILEALSQGSDGKSVGESGEANTLSSLKVKVQEAEKRVVEVEEQLEELNQIKKQQEDRIQQLEADYQTAVHYVQGSESTLQKLRDDAKTAESEKEALHAHFKELEDAHAKCGQSLDHMKAEAASSNTQLEEDIANLHSQLHDALGRTMELEQKLEELTHELQNSEASVEVTQVEFRTLKAKHHEHKKQGAIMAENFTSRLESVEASLEETVASLTETRDSLETAQYELEQAHELNKSTMKELDEALALKTTLEQDLKKAQEAKVDSGSQESKEQSQAVSQRQQELERAIEGAQRTIQSLQETNEDLEAQLRASETKISILLDNYQGPDSVRNSMASLSGGSDDMVMLMESNQHLLPSQRSSAAFQEHQHLSTPMSHGSHLTDRSSADSLANELELLKTPWGQAQIHGGAYLPGANATAAPGLSNSSPVSVGTPSMSNNTATSAQKLEEYERMIEDMAKRRQYEE